MDLTAVCKECCEMLGFQGNFNKFIFINKPIRFLAVKPLGRKGKQKDTVGLMIV